MPRIALKAVGFAALAAILAVSVSCKKSQSRAEAPASGTVSATREAAPADPASPAKLGPAAGGSDAPAAASPTGATGGATVGRSADGKARGRGGEGSEGVVGVVGDDDVAQRQGMSGQLTAGDWDDNLNFDFFRSYLSAFRGSRPDLPALALDGRVTIRVTDERGAPARHAPVTVRSGQRECLTAPTGADGRLLFFPAHDCGRPGAGDAFTVTAALAGAGARPVTVQAPRGDTWTVSVAGNTAPVRALDMALLIDTTGSMGDEIAYLQEEVRGIVESVRAASPGVSLRFSLVVYRDQGDEYVTRVFPFTDDLDAFRRDLSAQQAGGGGDYPEALDQGIAALGDLQWRTGDVARVAFLIADAPPHTERAAGYLKSVDRLRRRGVHIYPVGASGVADEAEYLMRLTAALTQARYLFLTDDSGIGNSHAEPHIPCYSVQKLDDLLRRMVLFELTGESAAPRNVIRTVGEPSSEGRCTLSGNRFVQIAR
jgi:hypothetical protein